MKNIANWGNYPVVKAACRSFDTADKLRALLSDRPAIARGLGRSYGDASLAANIVSTLHYAHLLDFDRTMGTVTCQGGTSLADLLQVVVPGGWFLSVTPGTKFVTVGGAIAADVHGKNHHRDGSFCRHVERMRVMMANGEVVECSPAQRSDVFHTTCGGMGLTGVILDATIRLQPVETAYVRQEVLRARDLDEIMGIFEASEDYPYSVAWIDCLAGGRRLGRSLMIRGEAAAPDALPAAAREQPLHTGGDPRVTVPLPFPGWVLNRWSIKAFNALYYRRTLRRETSGVVHYDPFFYPLDFVHHWNRIYGRRGFVQYQFVLPKDQSRQGLAQILERIHAQGWGSFLAVLKLLGPNGGELGFPMSGYTLALDFPMRHGLLPFLDRLDEVVAACGGRHYLVKDARLRRDMFEETYPQAPQFREKIRAWDPGAAFQSALSRRLGLTGG